MNKRRRFKLKRNRKVSALRRRLEFGLSTLGQRRAVILKLQQMGEWL